MRDISQIDFSSPARIWEIVSRHRWWFIIALFIAFIVGSYLAIVLPKIYYAESVIMVEPQRVPQNYVRSIVDDDVNARISSIAQQILSRTNLENTIRQFNLYDGPEFDESVIEDKVALLRDQIAINLQKKRRKASRASFTIGVKNEDPKLAMFIANALAASFITENLKVRETQALGTSEFLDSELEVMRTRLEVQEQKLASYRRSHMGELPEQLDSNLKIIQVLQDELEKKEAALQNLQSRIYQLNEFTPNGHVPLNPAVEPNINNLRRQLTDLEARYTPKHPDILRLKNMIRELEKRPPTDQGGQSVDPIAETTSQINQTKQEIVEIRNQLNLYKKRVEAAPKRKLDMVSLNRDYNNIKSTYQSLLKRKLEAEIAVNLERKQKGEQFRIIDRAVEPSRPAEPDMRRLFLFVLAAGFGLGGGLSLLLELFDNSFRSPEEVESALGSPILAMVPVIASTRTRVFAYTHNTATVIALVIVVLLGAGFWSLIFQGIEPTFTLLGDFLPESILAQQ